MLFWCFMGVVYLFITFELMIWESHVRLQTILIISTPTSTPALPDSSHDSLLPSCPLRRIQWVQLWSLVCERVCGHPLERGWHTRGPNPWRKLTLPSQEPSAAEGPHLGLGNPVSLPPAGMLTVLRSCRSCAVTCSCRHSWVQRS